MTDDTQAPPVEEAASESVLPEIPAPAEAPQQPATDPVVESPAPIVPDELNAPLEFIAPLDTSVESVVEAEPQPTPPESSAPPSSPPLAPTSSQAPASNSPAPDISIANRRAAALEKRRAQKQERLEKIVALARERGKITNNDVQLLLTVADPTATNYLNQLVVAARLRRVGKAKQPYYEPV